MSTHQQEFPKVSPGESLELEYGAPMPERERSGIGYPVFGSNGVVGHHSRFLIPGPGIVVGRKGSVGEVCWSNESFWPIDTAYYVVPKDDANLRWLYWLLKHANLRRLDAATGVPGLNRNDVYALKAHKPPTPDQPRIAAVLDTVDELIEKTEAVIRKLRQVRAGLLHDLLTRGLDAHGRLRPPPAQAPHLYQPSPLGPIPKEWIYGGLGEFIDLTVGPAFESNRFTKRPDDVRLLRGINVTQGRVRWDEDITVRWPGITPDLEFYVMQAGDVVIGMDGALGACRT